MIKAGTVKELSKFKEVIDCDVYRAAMRIVTILDEEYGADRDSSKSDGGFVLIVENVQDIADIGNRYVALDANRHEAVDVVKSEKAPYINAFFLCNNEFSINVFMPMYMAPVALLKNLSPKTK